jgi:hypothetical protein
LGAAQHLAGKIPSEWGFGSRNPWFRIFQKLGRTIRIHERTLGTDSTAFLGDYMTFYEIN